METFCGIMCALNGLSLSDDRRDKFKIIDIWFQHDKVGYGSKSRSRSILLTGESSFGSKGVPDPDSKQ